MSSENTPDPSLSPAAYPTSGTASPSPAGGEPANATGFDAFYASKSPTKKSTSNDLIYDIPGSSGLAGISNNNLVAGFMVDNPAFEAWSLASEEKDEQLSNAQRHGGPPPATIQGQLNLPGFLDYLIHSDSKVVEGYQSKLEMAGLLDEGGYFKGVGADPGTIKNMEYVFTVASMTHRTVDQVLDLLSKHPIGGGGRGGGSRSAAEVGSDQYKNMLIAKYISIWGVPPPGGYIERIMAGHMNIFEFEAHEKNKPAYKNSPDYHYNRIQLERAMATSFGSLG